MEKKKISTMTIKWEEELKVQITDEEWNSLVWRKFA